jgi:hypothetical protein
MEDLINAKWQAYIRQHLPAVALHDEIVQQDWDDGEDRYWCVSMALDATGKPQVMDDHGLCTDDDVPDEEQDGYLTVACPVDEDTTKDMLLDFDAAGASDWEDAWDLEDDEE